MAREFKPVRFFVMMAVAAFIVYGVTAFYTKRAEHGPQRRNGKGTGLAKKRERKPRATQKCPRPQS
jgi:hypothetical protein